MTESTDELRKLCLVPVDPQPTYIGSSGRWNWPLPNEARHPGCSTHVCTASREWWEYAPDAAKPHPRAEGVRLRDDKWYWAVPCALLDAKPSESWPTESEARAKAGEIMQRGRVSVLTTAIEEAIAGLESGMTQGALGTLREALHDDKSFYAPEPKPAAAPEGVRASIIEEAIRALDIAYMEGDDYTRILRNLIKHPLPKTESAAAPEAQPVPEICPNCDSEMPEGCRGHFVNDGSSCWLNKKSVPAPKDDGGRV